MRAQLLVAVCRRRIEEDRPRLCRPKNGKRPNYVALDLQLEAQGAGGREASIRISVAAKVALVGYVHREAEGSHAEEGFFMLFCTDLI